jgi:hypothetical protein
MYDLALSLSLSRSPGQAIFLAPCLRSVPRYRGTGTAPRPKEATDTRKKTRTNEWPEPTRPAEKRSPYTTSDIR